MKINPNLTLNLRDFKAVDSYLVAANSLTSFPSYFKEKPRPEDFNVSVLVSEYRL